MMIEFGHKRNHRWHHAFLWALVMSSVLVWSRNSLLAQALSPAAVERQLVEAFSADSPAIKESKGVPQKCATLPVFYYQQIRQQGGAVRPELETLFSVRETGAAFSIISPMGYFRLYYDVVGPNAVPRADTLPANGIPDYVERAAAYLDSAWTKEFVELGFRPPPINPPDVLYEVYFKDMNVYGYTTTISNNPKTYIVLENDFSGFPPNTDPEGHQLGALKVTIAHELKHASQYVTSYWSEGNWVELDATHMEDVVFDEVNDYYNYLRAEGSPLTSPTRPLDDGGGGSYEDCIWHHYLAEKFGLTILEDFWKRRSIYRAETVVQTYHEVLKQYGSSLDSAFAEFAVWNFFTGQRARAGWGYSEAAHYPTARTQQIAGAFPVSLQLQQLEHLSAYLVGLSIPVEQHLPVTLLRHSSAPLQWAVMQQTAWDSLVVFPFDGDTAVEQASWQPTANGQLVGMVVANGQMTTAVTVAPSVLSPPIIIEPLPFADTKQDTGSYRLQCRVLPYFSAVEDSGVRVIFSVSEATWDTVIAFPEGDTTWYAADLPAVRHGSQVRYFWQVVDTAGHRYTRPATAPDSVLAFFVLPDTTAPEITVVPMVDPAIGEVPLNFRARIQDELSAVDTAWVEIFPGEIVESMAADGGNFYAVWAVDTSAILPGDSVRYRWVARDSEGNERATEWFQFYWTRWLTVRSTPERSIPDNTPEGVRDTLTIAAESIDFTDPVITHMAVGVNGTHTWVGDLVIELTAPHGHTIRLMDHPGSGNYGSSANGPQVVFVDTAHASIQDIAFDRDSLVVGIFRPYPDKLATFQRLSPIGHWVLTVRDDSPGDSGAIQQWELRMKIRPYRGVLTGIDSRKTLVTGLQVFPNFPNPFNGQTVLPLQLGRPSLVAVAIYNILGQRIRTLLPQQRLKAGMHRITWDGRTQNGQLAPSGVYFFLVKTPAHRIVRKAFLLR